MTRPQEYAAAFQANLDRLAAQGDTMGNAWDRGFAARTQGQPIGANPWYDAQGELIHIAALDWRGGWTTADRQRQAQPDLFDFDLVAA